MRQSTTRILAPLFLLAVVISAAGCGSSSKNTTTTTTTTTAAAATTATTTTTASAPTTTSSSSGLAAIASAANCKEIAQLGPAFAQAMQGASGNVQKELQVFQEFAAKTPADVRPDFETIASALSKAASALKGVNLTSGGSPNPAALAKLSALASEFNSPALKDAETKIQAWAAANCHS